MVSLKVKGMTTVKKLFTNLPKNLQKEISKDSLGFLKLIRRTAKFKAPRDSGALADSIKIKKGKGKNENILEVTSPWAVQQETGKGLPHYMPISVVKKKKKKSKFKKQGTLPQKRGLVVARGYTPFITPAIEHNINKLSGIISQGTKHAVEISIR